MYAAIAIVLIGFGCFPLIAALPMLRGRSGSNEISGGKSR